MLVFGNCHRVQVLILGWWDGWSLHKPMHEWFTACHCILFSCVNIWQEQNSTFPDYRSCALITTACIHPCGLDYTVLVPLEWRHCSLKQDLGLFPNRRPVTHCLKWRTRGLFTSFSVAAIPLNHKSIKSCMTCRVEGIETTQSPWLRWENWCVCV